MILAEVRDLLRCTVFTGEDFLEHPVVFGCASDLMSDVLAFSQSGALLLTGLVSVQTVQTSHIADIVGIVIVRGKTPDASVVELARRNRMPLLGTPYSMYEACGILYRAGIPSTMKCAEATDRSQPA
jgi:predicted transcriptional regulator